MYVVGLVILYSTLSYLLFDKISRDDHMHPDQDDHTTSLSTSIEELPVISFPDRELAESSTCVICLEIFQHEERCRVFPVCKHLFHAHCIDLWLAKRFTCPICRAPCKIEVSPHFHLPHR
ncbi:hypothetical protein RHGRI_021978 [Rhododendron griersonianum]|uniref:RING-type domain-containing protein n=1 Tax=Rhododendron griersonianum TaxID=479676 RepID=A0AAV6JQL8_9ERIC|nr:hypothetical protein RHGRI_021978 [Rhododendron griersonianum]